MDFSNLHFYAGDFSPAPFSESERKKKLDYFLKLIERPDIGFFRELKDQKLVQECLDCHSHFKKSRSNIKNFIHVGIGGSALGAEMLVEALGKKTGVNFIFVNNIDPDRLHQQLDGLNPQECLFYFVSKSGSTAETMGALSILWNWLSKTGVSTTQMKDYFVVSTDPAKSQLKDLADKFQLKRLTIPSNIGGRFSVLCSVGYLPALFAGIEIEKLAEGARSAQSALLSSDLKKNPLLCSGDFIFALSQKGVHQTVLMPYSSRLRSLSSWFVQLWAESLGKKLSRDGKTVHRGLTPVPAYGATDQHSQVQLFMEGPYDKVMLMLEVEKFAHDYALKSDFEQDSLKKLAPFSLAQLMQAEMKGTLKALELNKRPYLHLKLPNLNETSLGALILYFESLTALMGDYLDINPFDQPGVEAGKIFAFEWLHQLGD